MPPSAPVVLGARVVGTGESIARGERFFGMLAHDAVLLMRLGVPAYAMMTGLCARLDAYRRAERAADAAAMATAEARVAAWVRGHLGTVVAAIARPPQQPPA